MHADSAVGLVVLATGGLIRVTIALLDQNTHELDAANISKRQPRHFPVALGILPEELAGQKTRLIVSGYWAMQPRWLQPAASFALLEWTHWIMQARQFANLKARVAH